MKNKIESIDYSGMIYYPDKEKPTYKDFEPLENKVMFESEEEAGWFYDITDLDQIISKEHFVEKVKNKNLIRKLPVEEAEEYIRHVEEIMDGLIAPSPKDLEYSVRIVEKLKSEIEKLKNWIYYYSTNLVVKKF